MISYEGSDHYHLQPEEFLKGQGLDQIDSDQFRLLNKAAPSQLNAFLSSFLRREYTISTASALEIKNRMNIFGSFIKSLEDPSILTLIRTEDLVSDHSVIGATGIFLSGDQVSQHFLPESCFNS